MRGILGIFAPAAALAGKLTISNALFSRPSIAIKKGGRLTIANVDGVAYRIKIGATVAVIPSMGSKSIRLPQVGRFPITCAKFPSLVATLTVK